MQTEETAAREPAESLGASPSAFDRLASVARSSARAERRLRLRRAFDATAKTAIAAFVLALVTLAFRKTGHLHETPTRALLGTALAIVVVGFIVGYRRRLPERAGAVALDRHHALNDRLSSALAFAETSDRTPFMNAAIEDAIAHANGVDPKRAVPLPLPKDAPFAFLMAALVAAAAVFEVRVHEIHPQVAQIDAVEVTPDDLDAMRDFLKELDKNPDDPNVKAEIAEFNQLIEDLAAKRLDRSDAFRKMQALEDKLLEGREADAKALEDALSKIGDEMKKAELTRPAGEALDNKNLSQAEAALRDLAKRLREHGGQMDKQQLEQMREALAKASANQEQAQKAIAQRREELKQDLLQRRNQADAGAQSEQEKSLLQKRERELERLDREAEKQEQTGRQLDRLDRELSQAAEDLMKDMGMSAQDLEQSAEDINRMAKQQMSNEEKEELRQKIQELREMLRQQGQGGQQQMARLRRFQSRAHGGQGQSGQQGQGQQGQGSEQEGEEGEGQQGQGGQGQNGQSGQGASGKGQQGQGQNGQGQGQNGQGGQGGQGQGGQGGQGQGQNGQTWILGPNGEKMMMLSRGQGSGGQGQGQGGQGGQGQGQGGNGQGGQGAGQGGQGWGTGHDSNLQGGATNPKVGTEDTQVAGQDTGQGGSRSEVIQGAAERGFASRKYTKVYRDYHTVAEEALNKDEIPGGYRFYVRRYFQLIRPRDEQEPNGPSTPDAPGQSPGQTNK